jgi:phospholipid/cholesterol/gamma-HCH transport system substrate-binding protein
MNETVRNIAVGLTVLCAFALFAAMVVIFTVTPTAFKSGWPLVMVSAGTHDIKVGTPVHIAGMRIGQVSEVRFVEPSRPQEGVRIRATIDGEIRLPASAKAHVFTRGLSGQPYLEIKPDGETAGDSAAGEAYDQLPIDGSVTLEVQPESVGLLPADVVDAARSIAESFRAFEEQGGMEDLAAAMKGLGRIGELADNLNRQLLRPRAATAPADGEAETAQTAPADANAAPGRLASTLDSLDQALGGLAEMLADPEARAGFQKALVEMPRTLEETREAMASLRAMAENAQATLEEVRGRADAAGEDFHRLSAGVIAASDELSRLLRDLQETSRAAREGEGTVGRLLNDPKVYQNLVDVTGQLEQLIQDLRVLTKSWAESGVRLRMD